MIRTALRVLARVGNWLMDKQLDAALCEWPNRTHDEEDQR